MLKKLLKYDINYIYKVLMVFYILSIFFAGLTRLVSLMESSTMRTIISVSYTHLRAHET